MVAPAPALHCPTLREAGKWLFLMLQPVPIYICADYLMPFSNKLLIDFVVSEEVKLSELETVNWL